MSFITLVCGFVVNLGIRFIILRAFDSAEFRLFRDSTRRLNGDLALLGRVFVEKSRFFREVKLARKVPLGLILTSLLALVGLSALGFRLGKTRALGSA